MHTICSVLTLINLIRAIMLPLVISWAVVVGFVVLCVWAIADSNTAIKRR